MSPRNLVTGLPEPIAESLCHYCGQEVDAYHDISIGARKFHQGCYKEYAGYGDDHNDYFEIED